MDEPRPAAATLPMSPPPPRTRRGWIVAVGLPAFLVGVAIAAHGPLLGALVRHRAASLGVELAFDRLELGAAGVRLLGVRASLPGVHGVRVAASTLHLETSWLSLASVEGQGVAVTIEGPANDRVLELASWSSDHPGTLQLHGSATDVRVEWRARPDIPAWLTMAGGTVTADGKSARLVAATSSAFGVPTGALSASVVVDAAGVTLEAGKKPGGEAPVIATLRTSAHPPELSVTLRPVEVAGLGTALGISLPAHAGVASGHVELTLGRAPAGTASLDLDGYVPAHPRALDGILFGKKTTVRSRLHVAEDRASVRLDDLEVRAGKLALKGSGTITEEGNRPGEHPRASSDDHAVIRLEIKGPIPCADLARGAASEELGGALGALAGELAGHAVSGSATVTVAIEADSRDLGAAKVKPKVGLGCEVKLPGF